MAITIKHVEAPQLLQVALAPPSPFNKLFIFVGTAVFDFRSDKIDRDRLDLSLSQLHNTGPINRSFTQVVASASPSSIGWNDDADEATWAVDKAVPVITDQGELILQAFAAVQGEKCSFLRFSYQVFLQTVGMIITDSTQDPITVSTAPVTFAIKLFPLSPNPGGQVNFRLRQGTNVLPNTDLGLPDFIDIPPLATFGQVTGTVQPHRLSGNFTLECDTLARVFNVGITIKQI